MLKNYFTIALRNLYKYWVYSVLNIAGLAVGISFFTLLFIIIRYETSFDTIHTKADRIYRVVEKIEQNGVGEESASLPFAFAPTLTKKHPNFVESTVRIFNFQIVSHSIAYEQKRFNEPKFYFTDNTFFDVFDYPLALGNRETALQEKNSVLLSANAAIRIFGEENPMGKQIIYEDNVPLTVTGVFKQRDYASHFKFDFIAPIASVENQINPFAFSSWVWNPCWTYIVLKENVALTDIEAVFPEIVNEYFPSSLARHVSIYLQPLLSIHLTSDLDYEISENGDETYIFIFSTIAALILVITIINFTNLSTARYSMRAKEIGIRKAIGADKLELVQQFLVESLFISVIGIICAFVLVEILIPHLSDLTNRDLTYNKIDKTTLTASLFSAGLFVGFLSSIYPSYYLSRFLPAEVMSGEPISSLKSSRFRSILVIVQFCITICLLISTMVSFKQVNYMRNSATGFAREQVVIVPIPKTSDRVKYYDIKESLLENEHIKSVTLMEEVLGLSHQTHNFLPENMPEGEKMIFLPSLLVDYDFIETFDINLIVGRSFTKDSADTKRSVIVNQELVRFMEWGTPENALGKTLKTLDGNEKVIGVVENFHFESLHEEVTPFVLDLPNNATQRIFFLKYIAIRTTNENSDEALGHIQGVWNAYIPNRNLTYFYLDKEMGKLYSSEFKLGKIAADFSIVAILIACLGLFGLASFVVEQKRKEIAIRKAIGTTDTNIIILLSNEFLALVGISLLISWPLSYLVLSRWLDRFPFHIQIPFMPFLLSGVVVLFITLLTVSYHTVRAAMKNPVADLNRE